MMMMMMLHNPVRPSDLAIKWTLGRIVLACYDELHPSCYGYSDSDNDNDNNHSTIFTNYHRSIIYTTINSSIITITIERMIQQSKLHTYALLSTWTGTRVTHTRATHAIEYIQHSRMPMSTYTFINMNGRIRVIHNTWTNNLHSGMPTSTFACQRVHISMKGRNTGYTQHMDQKCSFSHTNILHCKKKYHPNDSHQSISHIFYPPPITWYSHILFFVSCIVSFLIFFFFPICFVQKKINHTNFVQV